MSMVDLETLRFFGGAEFFLENFLAGEKVSFLCSVGII